MVLPEPVADHTFGAPPGLSSSWPNTRPSAGRIPSVGKYDGVTRWPQVRSVRPPQRNAERNRRRYATWMRTGRSVPCTAGSWIRCRRLQRNQLFRLRHSRKVAEDHPVSSLKADVTMQMPRLSESTATAVKPGEARSVRSP